MNHSAVGAANTRNQRQTPPVQRMPSILDRD
jgi:hypothetical protein